MLQGLTAGGPLPQLAFDAIAQRESVIFSLIYSNIVGFDDGTVHAL